jgi:hypothetical protein
MHARGWGAVAALAALLACNEGLQPTPAPTTCPTGFVGVCGTVTFQGQLPDSLKDSTQAVFIVAYHTFPSAPESLFHLLPFPPRAIPTNAPTYLYTLPLPNGRYEWVLAVWQKKSAAPLTIQNADTLLREIGFYRDGADTTPHGSGVVRVNATGTDSIDFVIDYGKMHRICDYFPPCP